MSERFGRVWQAIGTTFRYSIAGGVVFGLTGMVSQLAAVQKQLGLISAIGQTQGGQPIVGQNLDRLYSQSRQGAVEAITPIKDYNDAVINLLSTVSDLPQDQITPIVTQIAQAAQLSQVSAEDATKAFTTMNVAFGRQTNLSNIRNMAQEFFILTREAPGGVAAGQQVIGQLGQLAAVTRAARGTPEDMMGLLLSTLRGGIPPSQAGRGLQYLIQTLGFPGSQSSGARQALAQVGITPTTNMSLQQRLGAIFQHARKLGLRGNLGALNNLDEDTLSQLEATGDPGTALSELGITGAGAQYLGTVFKRIHALRTAIVLLGQVNIGQAQKDSQEMTGVLTGHVSDVNNLKKAWEKFDKKAQLSKAAVAINALSLQVANTLEPVLNLGARGITGIQRAAQHHQEATKYGVYGLGLGLGVMGIARFLGIGPRFLRRGIGTGGIAGYEAARDLSAIGLGASPAHPLYVIVVGTLFGGAGGGNTPDVPPDSWRNRLGRRVIPILNPKNWARAGMRGLRAAPGAGMELGDAALGEALPGVAGAALPFVGVAALSRLQGGPRASMENPSHRPLSTAALQRAWAAHPRIHQLFQAMQANDRNLNPQWSRLYSQFMTGQISAGQFDKLLGRADVYMQIDVAHPGGKVTQKRVHVPVDLWSGGRNPSSRGKKAVKHG
jgi:hypothetical protein